MGPSLAPVSSDWGTELNWRYKGRQEQGIGGKMQGSDFLRACEQSTIMLSDQLLFLVENILFKPVLTNWSTQVIWYFFI